MWIEIKEVVAVKEDSTPSSYTRRMWIEIQSAGGGRKTYKKSSYTRRMWIEISQQALKEETDEVILHT